MILQRVAVTGVSAITHMHAKVYSATDNPEDGFTLTPSVNVGAIGEIVAWYTSTTCDVRLLTPSEYRDGNKVATVSFHIQLADVTDADVITTWTPGFAGRIIDMDFVVGDAVTTGSKLSTLNAEIGTTNLTGGTIALTSANCVHAAVIAAAAITAANHFGATDTVSIEGSSTTAFSEGNGTLVIKYVAD